MTHIMISSCLFGLAFVIVSCYGEPNGVYHAQDLYGRVDPHAAPLTPAYRSPLVAAPLRNHLSPKGCQSAIHLIRPNFLPPTAYVQNVHYPHYRPRYFRKHRKPVTPAPSIFTRLKDIIVGKITFIKNGINYIAKSLGGAVVGIAETKAQILRNIYERIYGDDSSSEISDDELNELLDEYSIEDNIYVPHPIPVSVCQNCKLEHQSQPLIHVPNNNCNNCNLGHPPPIFPNQAPSGSNCNNCNPIVKPQASLVEACPTCYIYPIVKKNVPKHGNNAPPLDSSVAFSSYNSGSDHPKLESYGSSSYSGVKSSSESQAQDYAVSKEFVRQARPA